MDAFLTINGKDYSHKDINLIRDFFTDEQWDLIDYALSEYQDHEDSTEKCKELLDIMYQVFRSAYWYTILNKIFLLRTAQAGW